MNFQQQPTKQLSLEQIKLDLLRKSLCNPEEQLRQLLGFKTLSSDAQLLKIIQLKKIIDGLVNGASQLNKNQT